MDPDQTMWMRRLVWIHAGRKPIMLVLSWHGSYVIVSYFIIIFILFPKTAILTLQTELQKDFRELQKHVEDTGLLKVKPMFYVAHLVSILALEVVGYLILSRLGTSWMPYLAALMCFVTSQVFFIEKYRHFMRPTGYIAFVATVWPL
jgi:hypothetical protein